MWLIVLFIVLFLVANRRELQTNPVRSTQCLSKSMRNRLLLFDNDDDWAAFRMGAAEILRPLIDRHDEHRQVRRQFPARLQPRLQQSAEPFGL